MLPNYQIALPLQQPTQEDTTTYEFPSKRKRPLEIVGQQLTETDWSNNFKGDVAEHYAMFCLMLKGIRVYANTGCDGETDLVLQHEDNYYSIDVKLASWTANGHGGYSWSTRSAARVQPPVIPLIVVPATGQDPSGWYCRWHKNRQNQVLAVPGLQNLWD